MRLLLSMPALRLPPTNNNRTPYQAFPNQPGGPATTGPPGTLTRPAPDARKGLAGYFPSTAILQEGVPAQLRQADLRSRLVELTLPHRVRVIGTKAIQAA